MPRTAIRSENKEKIGTILDRNIVRIIRERSLKEGRTMSEIIQDAILKYNDTDASKSEIRRRAVSRFCSKPFNLSTGELTELLKEDYYDL